MQTSTGDISHSLTALGSAGLSRFVPAFAMAASRGGAILLQMLVQICIGALAGASGLGALQLFTSWTAIGGEVLAKGLPARSMRDNAVHFSRGDADLVRRSIIRSSRSILQFWLICASLAATLIAVAHLWLELPLNPLLIAALLAAPLFALQRLLSETLKAADAPLAAISLENYLIPLVLIATAALYSVTVTPLKSLPMIAAVTLGIVLTVWALRRRIQGRLEAKATTSGVQSTYAGVNDQRSLWASSVLAIVFLHLPFIMLPLYASQAEIGIFAVAHKLLNIITTLLLLQAAVFGPGYARSAANGDVEGLRHDLKRTQLISLAIFLPIALILLMFSDPLGGLFNVDSAQLGLFLSIMVAGQLINALTGLPGLLLNMTGAAAKELSTLVTAIAVPLVLAPVVGQTYGVTGITVLFSASLIIKNLASYLIAHRHLQSMEQQQ